MTGAQSLETFPHEITRPGWSLRPLAEAVRACLENQREQAFLWLPVLFACGVGTYFSLPFEPPLWPIILGLLFILSLGSLATHSQGAGSLKALLLIAAVFTGGVLAAQLRTASVYTPQIHKKMNYADVTGWIESLELLPDNKGSRAVLSGLSIEELAPEQTPRKVRIQIRKNEGLEIGQKIKVLASLNPPSDAIIPGGYDFRRAFYFQGLGAVGFAYTQPEILDQGSNVMSIEAVRNRITENIRAALAGPEGALVVAFTIGQKEGISEEDEEALRASGLAHILAISGMNVDLLAGMVFFTVRLLMALFPAFALRFHIKKIAAVIACASAILFMVIAGATIPTQRAVLMTSIVFLAVIMDRVALSMRLLAVAALVLLAVEPESLLSASFQMSFAAVTALIAAYEYGREHWINAYSKSGIAKRAALYFLGIVFSSVIASAATAPISAYHFQQVAVYGVLANLAAIPLTAFLIMPASLLALILMPVGLAEWPLYAMGWGMTKLIEIARFTAELPGAVLHTPGWPFSAFLMMIAAGLILILWRGRGKIIAAPLVLAAAMLIAANPLPDILIAAEGKLAAFRGKDGVFYATTVRGEKFTRENWERAYGLPENSSKAFPLESKPEDYARGESENIPLCDPQACRVLLKSKKISFLRHPYAQKVECAWADMIVSFEPMDYKTCRASIVINKFDPWRLGAHAVTIKTDGKIEVLTTRSKTHSTSARPWSVIKTRRSKPAEPSERDQES